MNTYYYYVIRTPDETGERLKIVASEGGFTSRETALRALLTHVACNQAYLLGLPEGATGNGGSQE